MIYSIPAIANNTWALGMSRLIDTSLLTTDTYISCMEWVDVELAKFGIQWIKPFDGDYILQYSDPDELVRFQLTWG